MGARCSEYGGGRGGSIPAEFFCNYRSTELVGLERCHV